MKIIICDSNDNIMDTMKSYTDLEQSKKLAEILPLESADMCYLPTHIGDEHHFIACLSPYSVCTKMTDVSIEYCTPCWSLAALLDVLPEIQGGKPVISLYDNYITYPHMSGLHTKADNLIDACYEMILKLHEQNIL